jgi:hypothetical protein
MAMAQFVAFDPNVEVSGVSMLSVFAAMGDKIRSALAKYNLDAIEPDKWYPIQPYLDFYREISEERYKGTINLMKIGMQVPEKAIFPPDIDSIQKAFLVLDEAYHLNHRGGDFGHYHAKIVSNRQIDLTAHNPFPCDLDYGIVQGLARRFKPPQASLVIYHDPMGTCRKKGDEQCTYHITW